MQQNLTLVEKLKKDLPASLVVFLVALPLCLGIAVASGASPFSGIIAGIVGGIVIGSLSGSQLSVSGPAAGLTVIVADAITNLGSFELFLTAVCIAGVLQVVLGYFKAGLLANFFPSSVIKGMLAAIGIILILKQIPHALGYNFDYEGDESFGEAGGHNTFTDIYYAFLDLHPGAVILCVSALVLMLLWDKKIGKINQNLRLIPGALLAVFSGVAVNALFQKFYPQLAVTGDSLVTLPTQFREEGLSSLLTLPDFSGFANSGVYIAAVTIALIASIESLLSIEATDRLDPKHRITPLNRELKAQGVGNLVSGLLGGLPVTAVIVRSSANIVAGAASKYSAILHGVLLVVCVLLIPSILNLIPLASLAAVLLSVGYKLTTPALMRSMVKQGISQYVPFFITILAIVFTDLLKGIAIGSLVGLIFVAFSNLKKTVLITRDGNRYLIKLRYNVTFINKAVLREVLSKLPNDSYVILDGTAAGFIDHDIIETMDTFRSSAHLRNITVELKKSNNSLNDYFRESSEFKVRTTNGKVRETVA